VTLGSSDLSELLTAAYPGRARCLCAGTEDGPELQIRRRGEPPHATHHLARRKLEAHLHARNCRFGQERAPAAASVKRYIRRGVLDIQTDGSMQMLPPIALDPIHLPSGPASGGGGSGSPGRRHPELLWVSYALVQQAGLPHSYPWERPRTPEIVARLLRQAAKRIYLGNTLLDERLILIPPRVEPENRAQLREEAQLKLLAAQHESKRILIFGTVKSIASEPARLYLEKADGVFNIRTLVTTQVVIDLLRRFPQVRQPLSNANRGTGPKYSVIALLAVEALANGDVKVIDGCFMLVSETFVPCASQNELIVVQKAYGEHRCFSKPLLYDRGDSKYHPDLIFYDVGPLPYMIEVNGMRTQRYLAHQDKKAAYYTERYGCPGWRWLTHESSAPPAFPRRGSRPISLPD